MTLNFIVCHLAFLPGLELCRDTVNNPGATVNIGAHLRHDDGHDFEVDSHSTVGFPLKGGDVHTDDFPDHVRSHLDQHSLIARQEVRGLDTANPAESLDPLAEGILALRYGID